MEEEVAYDGTQMVAAWNEAGNGTWAAVWGSGVDNLISVKEPVDQTEVMAVKDGRGSVVGYWRAEATTPGYLATADYSPEGRATQKTWATSVMCTEEGNTQCGRLGGLPFGFHSAYKSPAHGLLYFRNRWYSVESGQWLTQDPLGEVDSVNLYAFNRFDGVNHIDPFGLSSDSAAPGTTGPRHAGSTCLDGPDGTTCWNRPLQLTRDEKRALKGEQEWLSRTQAPPQAPNLAPSQSQAGADAAKEKRQQDQLVRATIKFALGVIIGTAEAVTPGTQFLTPPPDLPPEYQLGRGVAKLLVGAAIAAKGVQDIGFAVEGGPAAPVAVGAGAAEFLQGSTVAVAGVKDASLAIASLMQGNGESGGTNGEKDDGKRQSDDGLDDDWKPADVNDPANHNGCKAFAEELQAKIGGEVRQIRPPSDAPGLGPYRGGTMRWDEHFVVVKDGRVYDKFGPSTGETVGNFKNLWKYKNDINFGF